MEETTEQQITAAKRGDLDAISALLMHVSDVLRSFLKASWDTKWQNYFSVDDVLQESFADAFLSIDQFQGASIQQFEGWMKRLCKNNYIDALRGLKTEKSGADKRVKQSTDESLTLLFTKVSQADSPSVNLSKKEISQKLLLTIQSLPTTYASVVMQLDIDGKSAEDVAQSMNCSIGAVYMRRNRALKQLRRLMGSSVA